MGGPWRESCGGRAQEATIGEDGLLVCAVCGRTGLSPPTRRPYSLCPRPHCQVTQRELREHARSKPVPSTEDKRA